MRKAYIFFISILVIILLTACQSSEINDLDYSDDLPFIMTLDAPELNILQITDLHLFFGFDHQDRQTYHLIEKLVLADTYDLVVITGDLTMSPFAPWLIRSFAYFMDDLGTPWTFIFGNHETDFNTYQSILNAFPSDLSNLYFKTGPQLDQGGVGNFKITFLYQDAPFYHAYFLDSKGERRQYTEEEGKYDYLSVAQVAWYTSHIQNDQASSIVFMHTPLRQLMNPDTYTGIFREKKVYAQGKDTGFFNVASQYGKTEAIFFGHDHLNDFYIMLDDIMMGYGRVTGYNAYGDLLRGGRVFQIDEQGLNHTCLVLETEVTSCV